MSRLRLALSRLRWRTFFLLALTALVILSVAAGFYVARNANIPFDSETWKSLADERLWPEEVEETRLRMLNDLLAHHLHVGMSYSEVEGLLGPPDFMWKGDKWDPSGGAYYALSHGLTCGCRLEVLIHDSWVTPYLSLYFDAGDPRRGKLSRVRYERNYRAG